MSEKNCTCICDEKSLCCKMQNASIRAGLTILKDNPDCRNTILETLDAIAETLYAYNCSPRSHLRTRIFWVVNQIKPRGGELNIGERARLDMIIAELEALLNKN